jgi:hypothetical protein
LLAALDLLGSQLEQRLFGARQVAALQELERGCLVGGDERLLQLLSALDPLLQSGFDARGVRERFDFLAEAFEAGVQIGLGLLVKRAVFLVELQQQLAKQIELRAVVGQRLGEPGAQLGSQGGAQRFEVVDGVVNVAAGCDRDSAAFRARILRGSGLGAREREGHSERQRERPRASAAGAGHCRRRKWPHRDRWRLPSAWLLQVASLPLPPGCLPERWSRRSR